MNFGESLVVIVIVLVFGGIIYFDKKTEADLAKSGLCAVHELDPRNNLVWVYRPCVNLKP